MKNSKKEMLMLLLLNLNEKLNDGMQSNDLKAKMHSKVNKNHDKPNCDTLLLKEAKTQMSKSNEERDFWNFNFQINNEKFKCKQGDHTYKVIDIREQ